MDILAALEASPARSSERRCKVQSWLDEIPADQPGRDTLIAVVETTDPRAPEHRTIDETLGLLARLGLQTSDATLSKHRRRQCRCFQ